MSQNRPTGARTAFVSEQRLLDGLCAPGPSHRTAQLAALDSADWSAVIAAADRHGVRPLLYHRLTAAGLAATLPPQALVALRETFLLNGLRNELLYQDLKEVMAACQQQGVRVLLLKGAHLAQWVYKHPAHRPMADIDLLVPEAELQPAATALQALGYSCDLPAKDIPAWRAAHPDAFHLPSFTKPVHPRIELHWSLPYAPNRHTLDGCWERARPLALGEAAALGLSPEDLLVQLCLHARLHRFSQGLRPVCDLAETLRHHGAVLAWPQVEAQAKAWNAERCVHLGLWLSRQLLEAPVPESVLHNLEAKDFAAQWAELAQGIVLAGEDVPEATRYAMGLAETLHTWRDLPSPAAKIRLLLRKLFPSPAHMKRYLAEKHAPTPAPTPASGRHLTRALDLFSLGARVLLDGQLPACGRRLRWHQWLEESPR